MLGKGQSITKSPNPSFTKRSPIHQITKITKSSDAGLSMVKTATRSVDLEPIDRLEEKMKLLVGMVDRMKSEQARAAEENQRLSRELESMRTRIASSDGLANELSSLKEERDVIRTRVTEMLEQLEALNL
jgi:regulator of replication initiation timing